MIDTQSRAWDRLAGDPSLVDSLSRDGCILLLAWNDRNGIYTDADSLAEGMAPLSLEEARTKLREQLLDWSE